jgi:hypothetical protein
MSASLTQVSLYVIKMPDGRYFAGFDKDVGVALFVDSPIEAKKFSNKHAIKLRPKEMLVELRIDLSEVNVTVSNPFRLPAPALQSKPVSGSFRTAAFTGPGFPEEKI